MQLDVDFNKFEDKVYLSASNLQTLVSLKYKGNSMFMQHLNEQITLNDNKLFDHVIKVFMSLHQDNENSHLYNLAPLSTLVAFKIP